MEFFEIANIKTTSAKLQNLTIEQLTTYCSDIDKVLSVENDQNGEIYCVWGKFTVHRQKIKGGLRFSLPNCPNALAWTITTGHEPSLEKVVIHATINRTEHDAGFIESIEDFIVSWKVGLEKNFVTVQRV